MGALARYFLPSSSWNEQGDWLLQGEEAHHCTVVMRKGAGQVIELFDGEGRWAHAEIQSVHQREVWLKVLEQGMTPSSKLELTLFQAIPKGSNMDWIVEKAVELGIRRIQPIITERTVVRLDEKEKAKKVAKWQRVAQEACKQCGQNWMPQIATPLSYKQLLATESKAYDLKVIAAIQPDSIPFKTLMAQALEKLNGLNTVRVALAIGPEGDFTEEEYGLSRDHGFQFVTLGNIILRVETATLFALSVLIHELNQ